MIVMVCLDDHNGMLFNHRRQSRDKMLYEYIQHLTEGKRLWMNRYSAPLFADASDAMVAEDFLEQAAQEDYCFVENVSLKHYEAKIQRLLVFRWNRVYPADMHLDLLLDAQWHLVGQEEFSGNSHEKITMEVYEK